MPWWLSLTDEMKTHMTEELVLVFLLPDARWEFQVPISVQFDLKGDTFYVLRMNHCKRRKNNYS